MKKILIIVGCVVLYGCNLLHKHQSGVAVELNDRQLLWEDLDLLTHDAATPEDSARIAMMYISQWAEDILEYEEAKKVEDRHIEQLVENYRRSLYVYEYEQHLVGQKMSHQLDDSVVLHYYEQNKQQFVLNDHLVKGILLVLPKGAPKQERLHQWLKTPDEVNMEQIEKYAYQYASGYDLFTTEWRTGNKILLRLPVEQTDLTDKLKREQLIELTDSNYIYLLQVADKRLKGELMPMDYAMPEIQKLLLSQRQVEFLREHRDKLFEEARRFQKIKIYEKSDR